MQPVPVAKVNGHVHVEQGHGQTNPGIDQPDAENPATRNVFPNDRPKPVPSKCSLYQAINI